MVEKLEWAANFRELPDFLTADYITPPRSSPIKERLIGNWSRANLARWTYLWGSPRDFFFSASSRAVETWGYNKLRQVRTVVAPIE